MNERASTRCIWRHSGVEFARTVVITALAFMAVSAVHAEPLKRDTVTYLKSATVFLEMRTRSYVTDMEFTAHGSGFFISAQGHVVTNWHVVEPVINFGRMIIPVDPVEIKVYVNSGSADVVILKARVVAVDRVRDIAILAADTKKKVPFITLGVADNLFETAPVWVFGFPMGDLFSVMARGPEISVNGGTVTALRHDDRGGLNLIQTDAMFSPGSSGGALVGASGKALGIPARIIPSSRINLAIPSAFIGKLMAEVPLGKPPSATASVRFQPSPAGAKLFVDGRDLGTTEKGKPVTLDSGIHQVAFTFPGYQTWMKDVSLRDGVTVTATLRKGHPMRVSLKAVSAEAAKKALPKMSSPATTADDVLLEALFEKRDYIDTMEQSTGSTEKRTWYIRDGQLHQHESDGILHAIFMGGRDWTNYAFSADVRIKDEDDDSRAGLIFRETERGFYLFRIHRESNKAQLAFHSKAPFGWFVLDEKTLDTKITEKSNRLEIRAERNHIICRLDGNPIFRVKDDLANSGRVGFYSVESQAAFDNAVVRKVPAAKDEASVIPAAGYLSFWISDAFNADSTWWSSTEPWLFTDNGAVQAQDDARERMMVLRPYTLTDFSANLSFLTNTSEKKEGADPAVGVAFGIHKEDGVTVEYRVVVSTVDRSYRVHRKRGDKIEALPTIIVKRGGQAIEGMNLPIGALHWLQITVRGRTIQVMNIDGMVLHCTVPDKDPPPEGQFGIFSRGAKCIARTLTISSPAPVENIPKKKTDAPAEK